MSRRASPGESSCSENVAVAAARTVLLRAPRPCLLQLAPPRLPLLNFSRAAAARSPASPDTSDRSSSAPPTPGHSPLSAPHSPAGGFPQASRTMDTQRPVLSSLLYPLYIHIFKNQCGFFFFFFFLVQSYLFPGESKLLKATAVVSC